MLAMRNLVLAMRNLVLAMRNLVLAMSFFNLTHMSDFMASHH